MLFLGFAADCTLRRTNDGGEERDTDDRSRGRRGLRFVYLVTSQRFPQTSTLAPPCPLCLCVSDSGSRCVTPR